MSDFLDRVTAERRRDVAGASVDPFAPAFGRTPIDLAERISHVREVAVIAEVKKASPSAGPIAPDADVAERAVLYEDAGAQAVSVLAEPRHFAGSFEDVSKVSEAIDLPVLCKDFVVHPNQLLLARANGADAVLIMVGVLGSMTRAFVKAAEDCGLTPLVEVHDEREYAVAREAGARLLGVNARDLRDLSVDTEGTFELISQAAADGLVVVAESGIRERSDVKAAAEAGAKAVLVGETLMRSEDPAATLGKLTGVRAPTGVRS